MPELPDIVVYLDALRPRVVDRPLEALRISSPFPLHTVDPPVAEVVGRIVRDLRPQAIERPLEDYYTPPWLDWDLWLGPAPARPYHPAYAPFKWRGWWDFGTGALGDIACHSMDARVWALDLGRPTRIEPECTKLFGESAPAVSRIVYTFPAKGNRPEIKVVWRDGSLYPARPKEVTEPLAWPSETSGQMWIGDQGKLVAGIYGEDPTLLDAARQAELTAHPPAQKYPRTEGVYAEWIAACKGGPPCGSNFAEHAGPLSEVVLLGNVACGPPRRSRSARRRAT